MESKNTVTAFRVKQFVADKYIGQKIKISGEPYMAHLEAVAEMAAYATPLGYEIGLCHDLLEDSDATSDELRAALITFGYLEIQADYIASVVQELTDVFTAAAYPELTKRERKEKEATRILTISGPAQTVKYADLLNNISWTLVFERKKAKKYLKKKKILMTDLTKGDPRLYQQVLNAITLGLKDLKSGK